jgi:hypothetical protein
MFRDHFFVTLFSNASQDIYPDNKIAAFTTQLAQPIRLDPSEIWEVGQCELSYSASHGLQQHQPLLNNLNVFLNALFYCDLIAPHLIGTTKVRYLRSFRLEPTDYNSEYLFQNVYYLPLENETFRDIRIEILNQLGELIPFNDSAIPLKAVLLFRRVITP